MIAMAQCRDESLLQKFFKYAVEEVVFYVIFGYKP